MMRGTPNNQITMLSLETPEKRVPAMHPVRAIKRMADEALRALGPEFDAMYSNVGRPSIPPERLLKASLLMALYTVRSERLFCEQLDYNLLFRWFLDMDMVEESFDHSSFTRNRERLLKHDVAGKFFGAVVAQARATKLMSDEHFSVDGTLIEAWASMKSFQSKDDPKDPPGASSGDNNAWKDFKGENRSNETHESKTDPEAKLLRKGSGREAKLCFSGHVLMENRHGLVADVLVTPSVGETETDAALSMMERTFVSNRNRTVGGDRGYDNARFVAGARMLGATPHVAQNNARRGGSAVDGRTTSRAGYAVSLRWRMRIEEIFGWMKTVGGLRRTRLRGVARTQLSAYFVAAAYNLLRMARLCPT
jgi:transposase